MAANIYLLKPQRYVLFKPLAANKNSCQPLAALQNLDPQPQILSMTPTKQPVANKSKAKQNNQLQNNKQNKTQQNNKVQQKQNTTKQRATKKQETNKTTNYKITGHH